MILSKVLKTKYIYYICIFVNFNLRVFPSVTGEQFSKKTSIFTTVLPYINYDVLTTVIVLCHFAIYGNLLLTWISVSHVLCCKD